MPPVSDGSNCEERWPQQGYLFQICSWQECWKIISLQQGEMNFSELKRGFGPYRCWLGCKSCNTDVNHLTGLAGAVHGTQDSVGGAHPGEEHSIGSLPAGFFDDSNGRQVTPFSMLGPWQGFPPETCSPPQGLHLRYRIILFSASTQAKEMGCSGFLSV